MEAEFWHQRWRDRQIGFHQAETNELLQSQWPGLDLTAGASVFVPLAGQSLDMVWLASQGHKVVANELSEIAVDAFFKSLGVTPDVCETAGFKLKSSGPYDFWCGDFFSLPERATAGVEAIYDRASLIALPPELRRRYAEKLIAVAPSARMLLITLEYDQSVLNGPPHSVPGAEVRDLYEAHYNVSEIYRHETAALSPKFKEHGLDTVAEAVYVLTPHDAPAGSA